MSRVLLFSLFAQIDSLDSFVSALRDKKGRADSGEIISGLLILVAVSAAVWLLVWGLDRCFRGRIRPSPGRLLWSLSRAHHLRWSQWWLLRRIARQQKLEDPARLFLEPEWLDSARLGAEFAAQRFQVQILRARLFTDLAEMGPRTQPAGREGSPGLA